MPKRPTRENTSKRAKKKPVPTQLGSPPPPPFLHLRHGFVYEPEHVTLDATVCIPLSQLHNREAVYDTVLRKVLYHLHSAPQEEEGEEKESESIIEGLTDEENADKVIAVSTPEIKDIHMTHRSVVHVESITVHPDSARQVNHTGDVHLRASVAVVLARVVHGLLPGVAVGSAYPGTVTVRLRGDAPAPGGGPAGGKALLVTARGAQEEPVAPGQVVLLVSEPGTMRCLAIRPPRKAEGTFQLRVEGDVMEIEADWAAKRRVLPH